MQSRWAIRDSTLNQGLWETPWSCVLLWKRFTGVYRTVLKPKNTWHTLATCQVRAMSLENCYPSQIFICGQIHTCRLPLHFQKVQSVKVFCYSRFIWRPQFCHDSTCVLTVLAAKKILISVTNLLHTRVVQLSFCLKKRVCIPHVRE